MIRDEISVAGFALVQSLVDSAELVRLVAAAEQAVRHPLVRARRGSAFGLRNHLDDCPPENGALKIIPGSHAHGRLTDTEMEHWKSTVTPVTCAAHAGDALFLRPLLLHSSGTALTPGHRRVLHFEYAVVDLPGGLEWNA